MNNRLLRVGISPCPNDVLVFAGLISGVLDTGGLVLSFDFQDVETLNQRAQTGDAYDLVKISYANYAHCASAYDLLDCGGALGRGVGPLLLSNGAPVFDPDAPVLVPGEFTTANFLLDFYAGRPITKRFLPFATLYDELKRTPGARQGVVIHEKRFTFADDGLILLQDLGEHCERETGFAIPLGAIAARRDLDKERIEMLLRQSLGWAEAHRADALMLCREHAQDLTESVMSSHIALYVNDYTHDLGDDGRAAVAFFLDQQQRFCESGVTLVRRGEYEGM